MKKGLGVKIKKMKPNASLGVYFSNLTFNLVSINSKFRGKFIY